MASRTTKIVTVASTMMLVAMVLLSLVSHVINPWDHYLSFGDACHVGVWGRGLDSRFVVFNDAQYGPYRGSVIELVGVKGASSNKLPNRIVAAGRKPSGVTAPDGLRRSAKTVTYLSTVPSNDARSSLERETVFGDTWGIYYRYYKWPSSTNWTLMITLWYPLAISAIMPTLGLLRRLKHQGSSTAVIQSGG